MHNLTCGATIILANNGYIWIYSTPASENDEDDKGDLFVLGLEFGLCLTSIAKVQ